MVPGRPECFWNGRTWLQQLVIVWKVGPLSKLNYLVLPNSSSQHSLLPGRDYQSLQLHLTSSPPWARTGDNYKDRTDISRRTGAWHREGTVRLQLQLVVVLFFWSGTRGWWQFPNQILPSTILDSSISLDWVTRQEGNRCQHWWKPTGSLEFSIRIWASVFLVKITIVVSE